MNLIISRKARCFSFLKFVNQNLTFMFQLNKTIPQFQEFGNPEDERTHLFG